MNIMRKLLKSHSGLIHFDLEELICEQPCATGEDLNHFPRRITKWAQYVNMLLILLILKCEIPYYITVE